jgi:hypothetical protein
MVQDSNLRELGIRGRIGEVSKIGSAILYLESASSATGDTIYVDGGQSADHRTSYEGERDLYPANRPLGQPDSTLSCPSRSAPRTGVSLRKWTSAEGVGCAAIDRYGRKRRTR